MGPMLNMPPGNMVCADSAPELLVQLVYTFVTIGLTEWSLQLI